jgi:hypothetical protein
MVSTPSKPAQKAWATAIVQPGKEFDLTPLSSFLELFPLGYGALCIEMAQVD